MKTPVEVKNELLQALSAVVDKPLKQVHFARENGSLTYSRILNAAEQQINFVTDYFPKYQPNAEAHIHPMLLLRIPRVSERALALVKGNNLLLADAPDVIVNQPIEFAAPKCKHQRWFANSIEQFVSACTSIQNFLAAWVLPFLSEISTPAELVKLYEMKDARVLKQKHWHIFIAAAYEELGQPDRARQVVRDQFSSPGLRKRYAPLFDSLGVE